MCKKCMKCDLPMRVEDGVYTCDNCLSDLIRIKREQWEAESGIRESESKCERDSHRQDSGAKEETGLFGQ